MSDPAIRVYGLKNCDSCRRAVKWLRAAGQGFAFIDVRADDLIRADVARIVAGAGADKTLNRKSTTWRQLSDHQRKVSTDQDVVDLIVQHPTLLKRPVIELVDEFIVGFAAAEQADLVARLA